MVKTLFLLFNILEIEKKVFKCFPPIRPNYYMLHTVVVLHNTYHIKWHEWSKGGGTVKMLKNNLL